MSLSWASNFALHTGDYEKARTLDRQAAEVAQALGSEAVVARGKVSTGNLYLQAGLLDDARPYYQDAISWAERRSPDYLPVPLVNLVLIDGWAGRYADVEERIVELLGAAETTSNTELVGWALVGQTLMLTHQGEFEQAYEVGVDALARVRSSGQKTIEVWCLAALAVCHIDRHDIESTRTYLTQAEAVARDLGRGSEDFLLRDAHAMLALAEGDLGEALRHWIIWAEIEASRGGAMGLAFLTASAACAVADDAPDAAATLLAVSRLQLARSGAVYPVPLARDVASLDAVLRDVEIENGDLSHEDVVALLRDLSDRLS